MKALLIAALLSAPLPAYAAGALFQKEISVSAAEAALRTPPPADPGPLIETLRWQVLQASNAERARAGLSPLAGDPVLDAAAARYSEKMRDFNFFDHVSPDGEALNARLPRGEMWRYQGLGENLWSGQGALDWRSDVISAEAAANWVESPGHRENILDPAYTVAGVGSAMRGDQLYITMLYATPVDDPAQAILQRDFGDAPADLNGFAVGAAQRLADALNAARGSVGLGPLGVDPLLSQMANGHASLALGAGGFDGAGSVLDRVFQADPTLTGRLAAGFWRGSGGLIWQDEALAQEVVSRWQAGQTGSDVLDPGFRNIGVGVASDGETVMVTVLFSDNG